ncbi:MAG: hypothetical protein DMD64_00010 [Gemmatimonadetes bacterium]|nr:MAG: hypothetical protein DMD64_00010 [Gemmatimonadota bacterium]
MTFGRLLVAWLPVAALFTLAPPIGYRWDLPPDNRALVWSWNRWEIGWRWVEALVLTLFASLWFDSLGAGGWWLLFFLVGLLVAFPRRLVMWRHVDPLRRRHLLVHAWFDVARYVIAGALFAWRLS